MDTDTPPNMEESSDEIIPEDVSLPSQFLLPNLDNSSDDEDTKVTDLVTEAEISNTIPEEEMPSVNSEATSLVNTNEFLEFMDTIDMGESEKTDQSEFSENLDQSVFWKNQIPWNRLQLTQNQKVNLANSCLIMKMSHLL